MALDQPGLLSLRVHAAGFDTRLSLLDDQGRTITQSEAASRTDLDDRIDIHLPPGSYQAAVASLDGSATGEYSVTVDFSVTSTPGQNLPTGLAPWGVATGDFNGDGKQDYVAADLYRQRADRLPRNG